MHCELCDLKNLDCCNTCIYTAIKQFIELFNRLQAENEVLNFLLNDAYENNRGLVELLERAKAEAYKEVFEKLKDKSIVCKVKLYGKGKFFPCLSAVTLHDIKSLEKELVGDK